MSDDDLRPLLYSLADALEIDLTRIGKDSFTGARKATLELFEGYSPAIASSIERSFADSLSQIVAADVHIFGNLGVVAIVEGDRGSVHLFVYDRSKRPEGEPWEGTNWSRKRLYAWLGASCKAIYYRSTWDTEWSKLEAGPKRLRDYNETRKDGKTLSKTAYAVMWNVHRYAEEIIV